MGWGDEGHPVGATTQLVAKRRGRPDTALITNGTSLVQLRRSGVMSTYESTHVTRSAGGWLGNVQYDART